MQNMMGQNIIITEPSKNLRALGRNAMAGKWKLGILAMLVYTLCVQIPASVLNAIFGKTGSAAADATLGAAAELYNSAAETALLSDIYVLLVTGALQLGITLVFLAIFRKQLVDVMDVFLGFENFGKALGLLLFQGLFVALWSLLFVIPGIIAAFRYSQAFFILADNPEKGIRQCMDESKVMMKGNKMKYFCLSMSFIGWILLSALPVGVLEGIADLMNIQGGVGKAVISILESVFMVPVLVYSYATMAGFYEILAGHLIKDTEPAPVVTQDLPADKEEDFFIPEEK